MRKFIIITLVNLVFCLTVSSQSMEGDQNKLLNDIGKNMGSINVLGGVYGPFLRIDDGLWTTLFHDAATFGVNPAVPPTVLLET